MKLGMMLPALPDMKWKLASQIGVEYAITKAAPELKYDSVRIPLTELFESGTSMEQMAKTEVKITPKLLALKRPSMGEDRQGQGGMRPGGGGMPGGGRGGMGMQGGSRGGGGRMQSSNSQTGQIMFVAQSFTMSVTLAEGR